MRTPARLPRAALFSPTDCSHRNERSTHCPLCAIGGQPEICSIGLNQKVRIDWLARGERCGGRDGGGLLMSARLTAKTQQSWNKGLLVGQKKPLEPKHVWSIRVRLELAGSKRDLAIFNLAIDSKLRACDLVKLRLDDIFSGAKVRNRATIVQRRQGDQCNSKSRSNQEIPLKPACRCSELRARDFSFKSPSCKSPHIYPPICSTGAQVGGKHRPRHEIVWHAHDASDQGSPPLPKDR